MSVLQAGLPTESSGSARHARDLSQDYADRLQPIDPTNVVLGGEFGRRVDRIVEANILKIDVDETFLAQFRNRGDEGYFGIGKFLDAVIRLGAATKDGRLLDLKQRVIAALLSTQDEDGYIGAIKDRGRRIKALYDLHEGAYVIWALVSDHRFFGSAASLHAAQRLADFFVTQMTRDPQLRPDVEPWNFPFEVTNCGLDRALLALAEATGQAKYRDFVVDVLRLEEYGPPIHCGTTSELNHAYTYLSHCVAQLDLYRQTGDSRLLKTSKEVLSFLIERDGMVVTGSCSQWECWHDTQSGLGNSSETCASAYLCRLMESLLRVEGDSLHGDIMERDIYNALFAATSPDGTRSRYHTAFDGKRAYDPNGHRYCCANNNKRFLADLRGWIYYKTQAGLAINLYSESSCQLTLASGHEVRIQQYTDYPSSGKVRLKVDPSAPARFEIRLRIPRWCKRATISIGDDSKVADGGRFYGVTRMWSAGDTIELDMPMEWRFIRGRRAQAGRAAILRGPVLFTFNPDRNSDLSAQPGFEPRLLRINPLETSPEVPDNSVRPDGRSGVIHAWPHVPSQNGPWPFNKRIPVLLTEYPDPAGEAIYFMVPGPGQHLLVDDELVHR
jgi:uncharacterized protein